MAVVIMTILQILGIVLLVVVIVLTIIVIVLTTQIRRLTLDSKQAMHGMRQAARDIPGQIKKLHTRRRTRVRRGKKIR